MDEQPAETTLYSFETVLPRMPERRHGERHISLLRVGSLVIGDRRELCLIRKISAAGMLIRVYSAVRPGTRVLIELKHGQAVRGMALWAKQEIVGVSFDAPIDMLSLITAAQGALRPRMPRLEVESTALVRDGAAVHRSRVMNISQGGVRIEPGHGVPIGAQVTVTLPGLPPEQGVVCWNDGESCGIMFNRILALPQLVAWAAEQQPRRQVGR